MPAGRKRKRHLVQRVILLRAELSGAGVDTPFHGAFARVENHDLSLQPGYRVYPFLIVIFDHNILNIS